MKIKKLKVKVKILKKMRRVKKELKVHHKIRKKILKKKKRIIKIF